MSDMRLYEVCMELNILPQANFSNLASVLLMKLGQRLRYIYYLTPTPPCFWVTFVFWDRNCILRAASAHARAGGDDAERVTMFRVQKIG